MVLQYILGDFKISYPFKFPYPVNVQEFICDLILILTYPTIFSYHTKDLVRKSAHFSIIIIIRYRNHQV